MKFRLTFPALATAAAALAVAPSGSGVSVSEKVLYYDVAATTAAGLVREMEHKGPVDQDGEHYWGYTAWEIEWSYPYERGESRCTTGPVQVKVALTTTLPRWQPPADAPAGLVQSWRRFLAALARHEDGHADLARSAAKTLHKALQGVAPRRTCDDLERAADAEGDRQLDLLDRSSAAYDAETDHGAKDGVELK